MVIDELRKVAAGTVPGGGGAEKVYRGNLEIWSAENLRKLDGITKVVGNLTLMTSGVPLLLPTLEVVEGSLNLGNDKSIDLPRLQRVSGEIGIGGNGTTERISLPALEIVGGGMGFSSASYPLTALKTLDLPNLRQVGRFSTAYSGLRQLALPRLESAGELSIKDSRSLESIDLGALKHVEFWLEISNNPRMPVEMREELRRRVLAAGIDPAIVNID